MTAFLFDNCGHRPLTYGMNWDEVVNGRVTRCVMHYCDRCVPEDVKESIERKEARQ